MYSINEIEEAINRNQKIAFTYFDLDYKCKRVYRKDGGTYEVNPIATIFSNDNYYLVTYSDKYKNYTNYRIDRMDNVKKLKVERTDTSKINDFDIVKYRKESFGMFSGKAEKVTLEFSKDLIDVIFDKFGEKTTIVELENGNYETKVKVAVSDQFFGTLLGLGTRIRLTAPESIVQNFKDYVQSIAELY